MSNWDMQRIDKTDQDALSAQQFVRVPSGYEVTVEDPRREEGTHLRDLIGRVWRRRWLILSILLASVMASAYLSSQSMPVYTAFARLRVGSQQLDLMPFPQNGNASRRDDFYPDTLETHAVILQGRPLAQQVVKQLNLFDFSPPTDSAPPTLSASASSVSTSVQATQPTSAPAQPENWSFMQSKPVLRVRGLIDFLMGKNDVSPTVTIPEAAIMQMRVDFFLRGLQVKPIPGTQIILVSYTSPDPHLSAAAVNALCENYVNYEFNSKIASYSDAQKWLKGQMLETMTKLSQAEDALYKFTGKDGSDFIMLSSSAQEYYRQVEDIRSKLTAIEQDLERRNLDLERTSAGAIPESISAGDTRLDALRTQLAGLEVEYDSAKQTLGPMHSKVATAGAAKARVAKQIAQEEKRLVENARFAFEKLKKESESLRNTQRTMEQRIIGVQQRLSQYNILKRDLDINKELYNNLLQKWRELSVAQGIHSSDIAILQAAEEPLAAMSTGKNRLMLLGLILGLGLGVGLAFFLDYMDVSVKTPAEVAGISQFNLLGGIPNCSKGPYRARKAHPGLLTHDMPYSGVAEKYRVLRAMVQGPFARQSSKTILVTSAHRGEGKTTTAVNMATAFAQKGQRVLLIDADLKKPELHKILGVNNQRGLADLLGGTFAAIENGACTNVVEEFISPTCVPGLYMLPARPPTPNSIDLLDSETMRGLLAYLKGDFAHIIIDSPPSLIVPDAGLLMPYVDEVVLVVRPGYTSRRSLAELRDLTDAMGARIVGIVLNNPKGDLGKSFSLGYGYNYRYGDGYRRQHTRPMAATQDLTILDDARLGHETVLQDNPATRRDSG